MNLKRISLIALAALGISLMVFADDPSQSSVVRRRTDADRNAPAQAGPGGSKRMELFYQETPVSDADLQYMRVIYRALDLTKDENAPLYFPEEPLQDQENLFHIIMRLVANNQIPVYEYLDGREIFTDDYRAKVRDVLDRFYIIYTEAKGSTEKNPRFVIEDADIPTNEVLTYYIIERWEFDTRTNSMRTRVEAICPVLHRIGDFGGDPIRYPMFWVKMADLRPHLAAQYIFTSDDNNLATCTYDDYFNLAMYKGDIYKTRNLQNKTMAQLYPDVDQRQHARDSIDRRLRTYTDHMWVPNREDIIAAREAREALANGTDTVELDSLGNPVAKPVVEKKSTRSSRNKSKSADTKEKKAKTPKAKKEPKAKSKDNSSSSAGRSVRRRK